MEKPRQRTAEEIAAWQASPEYAALNSAFSNPGGCVACHARSRAMGQEIDSMVSQEEARQAAADDWEILLAEHTELDDES
jgi:hypothetical protein